MKRKALYVPLAVATAFILGSTTASQDPPQQALVPVYYVDGSSVPGARIVIGRIPIAEGPVVGLGRPGHVPLEEFSVTLSNGAAFSNVDSYSCFVTHPHGAGSGMLIRRVDGSHFVFSGARIGPAWQQDFLCIGN
jgi:hypothetical protein